MSFRKLERVDRCDSCGAQAYVLAIKAKPYFDDADPEEDWELLFCSHHGHRYMDALVEQGFSTADYSNQLQESNAAVLL